MRRSYWILVVILLSFPAIVCSHVTAHQKILDLGLSRRLFSEELTPTPKLLQLLHFVGMPESENTIEKINNWAQKNLLRKGERWETQSNRFECTRSVIKPLLADLGFVDAVKPSFNRYEGSIVHGSNTRIRLHYLVELWKKGIRFSHLYLLSSDRLLEYAFEPSTGPKTEYEMTKKVWESEIPDEMRQQVKVYFVNLPMRQDSQTGKLIRPNTDDTIETWLKQSPPIGRYLAVTNAPYMVRQDIIAKRIAPKEYTFDTVGPAIGEQEKIAILLDELARAIFQIHLIAVSR